MEEVAQGVKDLRLALSLTQAELAARVGVSVDTVRSWENSRRRPSGSAMLIMQQLREQVAGLDVDDDGDPL